MKCTAAQIVNNETYVIIKNCARCEQVAQLWQFLQKYFKNNLTLSDKYYTITIVKILL